MPLHSRCESRARFVQQGQFCVVRDHQFRGTHSISVHETTSDPASFVATLAGTNAPRTIVSSNDALHPQTQLATLKPGPPPFDLSSPQPQPRFAGLDAIATPSPAQIRASGASNALLVDSFAALWNTWGNPESMGNGRMAATCPVREGEDRMFCVLLGCVRDSGPIGVHVMSFGMMLPSRLDLSVVMENGYRLDVPLDAVPDVPLLHYRQIPANTVDVLLRFLKKDQFARLEYATQTGEKSHLMMLSGSSQALSRVENDCSNG